MVEEAKYQKVFKELKKHAENTFKKVQDEKIDIIPEHKFTDDLGADSLDIVELMMALEEEMDIDISDDASVDIVTVDDAVRFLAPFLDDEVLE